MTFSSITKRDLFKNDFAQGLKDPTLKDFRPLTFSQAYKPEYKKDKAEWEYIDSFVYAANCLLAHLPPFVPGRYVFTSVSIPLVIAYLCRHAIELIIKKVIIELGIDAQSNASKHNLCVLWEDIERVLLDKGTQNRTTLSAMKKFVSYVNDIDCSGTRLRYATSTNGKLSCEEFTLVNSGLLVERTKMFVENLKEYISTNGKAVETQ